MKIFKPKKYYKSIFDINYNKLKDDNIKYLIFDLDNTLGLIDEGVINDKTKNFLNKLQKDFKIIIASNNNKDRVLKFVNGIDIDVFAFSLKPSGKIFRYLKKKYTKNMNEVAIIGDQLLTDILVGNRFGMLSIMIDPLGEKDLKITSFNRFLERKIFKRINFKRGNYYEKE